MLLQSHKKYRFLYLFRFFNEVNRVDNQNTDFKSRFKPTENIISQPLIPRHLFRLVMVIEAWVLDSFNFQMRIENTIQQIPVLPSPLIFVVRSVHSFQNRKHMVKFNSKVSSPLLTCFIIVITHSNESFVGLINVTCLKKFFKSFFFHVRFSLLFFVTFYECINK